MTGRRLTIAQDNQRCGLPIPTKQWKTPATQGTTSFWSPGYFYPTAVYPKQYSISDHNSLVTSARSNNLPKDIDVVGCKNFKKEKGKSSEQVDCIFFLSLFQKMGVLSKVSRNSLILKLNINLLFYSCKRLSSIFGAFRFIVCLYIPKFQCLVVVFSGLCVDK